MGLHRCNHGLYEPPLRSPGSALRVCEFDEVDTDSETRPWMDPTLAGNVCRGQELGPGESSSHGIQSPSIVRSWATPRIPSPSVRSELEATA